MSSGYASVLSQSEGLDLPDWVLDCVQAFRLLVEPPNAPAKKVEEPRDESGHEARETYNRECHQYWQVVKAITGECDELLAQINRWAPSLSSQQEFKDTFVKQLRRFIARGWLEVMVAPKYRGLSINLTEQGADDTGTTEV